MTITHRLTPPPAPEFNVVINPISDRGGDGPAREIDGDLVIVHIRPHAGPGAASAWAGPLDRAHSAHL